VSTETKVSSPCYIGYEFVLSSKVSRTLALIKERACARFHLIEPLAFTICDCENSATNLACTSLECTKEQPLLACRLLTRFQFRIFWILLLTIYAIPNNRLL
jgi:hypothetical protein